MKNNKTLWISLAVLVGGFVCLVGCLAIGLAGAVGFGFYQMKNPMTLGAAAPDFELTTLGGDTIRLSDFQGQPVVLSMGATWCPDCRREAPLLQNLHETYPDVVVISVDSREDIKTVQAFADEFGLTYPIALDSEGDVLDTYGIIAIPTLFFIDEQGLVQAQVVEQVTDEALVESLTTIGVTR
jgi:peroxiredoxin